MSRYLKHAVMDDFLPRDLHEILLAFTLNNRAGFEPNKIYGNDGGSIDTRLRQSLYYKDGLGHLRGPFRDAIKAAFPDLLEKLGMPAFEIAGVELELAAHGDGSFFKQHIDTLPLRPTAEGARNRTISAVYYFHTQPKRFSGGELAIAPIGPGDPVLVEPRDNRLVAFPSFAPHEVRPVICPGDAFEHARFAVNCWLYRATGVAPA